MCLYSFDFILLFILIFNNLLLVPLLHYHSLFFLLIATLLSGDQVCKGLGWTMMAIFDQCRKVNVGETGDRVRLPLYDGSPRVLYSLQQPPSPGLHACLLCFPVVSYM